MDENVDIKVNADGGGAQAALEQIAASFEKIADRGQKAGQQGAGGLGGMLHQATAFAGAMIGVESAIGAVEKGWEVFAGEVDRWLERMQNKAEKFTELALAQEKLSYTNSPSTIGIVQRLHAKIGPTPGDVDAIAGLLASRQLSEDKADELVQTFATMRPGAISERRLVDVAGLMNKNSKLSPEQAVAAYFQYARRTYEGVPPVQQAIQRHDEFGDDPGRFLSLGAAFSMASHDPEAAQRALMVFLPKLADSAHSSGFKGHTEEDLENWITGTDRGKAFARRMLSALHDPESPIAQKLNGGSLGQDRGGKLRVTEQQFLRGLIGEDGGDVWKSLGEGRQAVTDPALLSAEQKQIAELGKSKYQRLLDAKRHFEGATSEILENDELGAEYGFIREQIGKVAGKLPVSAIREKLTKTIADVDFSGAQTVGDVDRLAAKALLSMRDGIRPGNPIPGKFGRYTEEDLRYQEQHDPVLAKNNEVLERLARWLESRGETQRVIIESEGVSHRGVIAQERAGEQ